MPAIYICGSHADGADVMKCGEAEVSKDAEAKHTLEALEEICDEAVDRHSVHAHGPGSVQCDSICELIPKMRAAIRKATAQPNGREG